MKLTQRNYFSRRANKEFMSVSQFKAFERCQHAALAEIMGKYKREKTTSLLAGSYVDAYFEGTLGNFVRENPEIFKKDGTYLITKVADKIFIGKDILYVNLFKKNDKRTIYNVVYRDGKYGTSYVKRFNITGVTRDKVYNLTKGTAASKVLYFSGSKQISSNLHQEQCEVQIRL